MRQKIEVFNLFFFFSLIFVHLSEALFNLTKSQTHKIVFHFIIEVREKNFQGCTISGNNFNEKKIKCKKIALSKTIK